MNLILMSLSSLENDSNQTHHNLQAPTILLLAIQTDCLYCPLPAPTYAQLALQCSYVIHFIIQKFQMVQLRGIDGLFLHVYLSVYKFKPRDLALSERGCIRNSEAVKVIREAYRTYQNSGQNIEDFFDIQILNFEAPGCGRSYIARSDSIERNPTIICSYKDKNRIIYNYNVPLSDLKINRPIKMSLRHIFAIYGILSAFDDSNVQGMFRLEDMHSINIHLYELDDEDRGYLHSGLPGTRECYDRDVYIGKRGENYYWIGKNLVKKRYVCTKLPGKCTYQTYNPQHMRMHEPKCTDQTTITATQVNLFLKKAKFNTYSRGFMAKKKIRFKNWWTENTYHNRLPTTVKIYMQLST